METVNINITPTDLNPIRIELHMISRVEQVESRTQSEVAVEAVQAEEHQPAPFSIVGSQPIVLSQAEEHFAAASGFGADAHTTLSGNDL